MAEWQLGNHDSAREWYAKGNKWLEDHPQVVGGDLHRFREEADVLLGIKASNGPAAKSDAEKHFTSESTKAAQ
jgi:hypothetical protein